MFLRYITVLNCGLGSFYTGFYNLRWNVTKPVQFSATWTKLFNKTPTKMIQKSHTQDSPGSRRAACDAIRGELMKADWKHTYLLLIPGSSFNISG